MSCNPSAPCVDPGFRYCFDCEHVPEVLTYPVFNPGNPTEVKDGFDRILDIACGETKTANITTLSGPSFFRSRDLVTNLSYFARKFKFTATDVGHYQVQVATGEFTPVITVHRAVGVQFQVFGNTLAFDLILDTIGPLLIEVSTQERYDTGEFNVTLMCPTHQCGVNLVPNFTYTITGGLTSYVVAATNTTTGDLSFTSLWELTTSGGQSFTFSTTNLAPLTISGANEQTLTIKLTTTDSMGLKCEHIETRLVHQCDGVVTPSSFTSPEFAAWMLALDGTPMGSIPMGVSPVIDGGAPNFLHYQFDLIGSVLGWFLHVHVYQDPAGLDDGWLYESGASCTPQNATYAKLSGPDAINSVVIPTTISLV